MTRCRRYNFVVYEAGERLETALAYNLEFARACAAGDASRAATVIRESNEWTRDLACALLKRSHRASRQWAQHLTARSS